VQYVGAWQHGSFVPGCGGRSFTAWRVALLDALRFHFGMSVFVHLE
jgi:hypothetical protein